MRSIQCGDPVLFFGGGLAGHWSIDICLYMLRGPTLRNPICCEDQAYMCFVRTHGNNMKVNMNVS